VASLTRLRSVDSLIYCQNICSAFFHFWFLDELIDLQTISLVHHEQRVLTLFVYGCRKSVFHNSVFDGFFSFLVCRELKDLADLPSIFSMSLYIWFNYADLFFM
jgi:hypothetical protein